MEPHAIPRQITTFEFKLIGFLTLKQFLYLMIFTGLGVALYIGFPLPLINILLAGATISLGAALAFLPINDRPLDVWITNFFNRLTQPSQFYFHKTNEPPTFLNGIYLTNNTTAVANHIDATEKLKAYTASKESNVAHDKVGATLGTPHSVPIVSGTTLGALPTTSNQQLVNSNSEGVAAPIRQQITTDPASSIQHPVTSKSQSVAINSDKSFLSGSIVNSKQAPIPGILVYIKGQDGKVLRILKSNHSGRIATFHPLENGSYILETKDPGGKYFFDTMNLKLDNENKEPLHIISKEIL